MTDTRLLDKAGDLGREHGFAAASWVFDGNTTRETYARYLAGLEDGDPEIMDALPSPDLGGEWAGSFTSKDLATEIEIDPYGDEIAEACCEYETCYGQAVQDEIQRQCQVQLAT